MQTQSLSNRANPKHVYVHPQVKRMLDKSKERITKKDWDRLILIDGGEGSGKSLLALQIGFYFDPTLNLSRVCFNGEEFSKAIDDAKKFQCIIFDEAFNGLASTAATSKMNRFIVRKLMECRQKNLFIIIVLPTFFLLQKYVAIFRSKALFHVYVDKKGNRGKYKIYNDSNKKYLYLKGIKFYSYSQPRLRKIYDFGGKYPINEEEYRDKKHKSLTDEFDKQEKVDKYALRFAVCAKLLKDHYKMPYTQLSRHLKEYNLGIYDTLIGRMVLNIPKNHTPQSASI